MVGTESRVREGLWREGVRVPLRWRGYILLLDSGGASLEEGVLAACRWCLILCHQVKLEHVSRMACSLSHERASGHWREMVRTQVEAVRHDLEVVGRICSWGPLKVQNLAGHLLVLARLGRLVALMLDL